MASQIYSNISWDSQREVGQVTEVRQENFSLIWSINNFGEFMNRKYEFSSPIFSRNIISGTSKWKMMVFPENIYPEGTHLALRILKISEDDISHSVIYTISFVDANGTQIQLKSREKVFRHCKDFDECLVISNNAIRQRCLLQNESLTISCEFDLLICENQDDVVCKSYENPDDETNISSGLDEKINLSSMNESINDLSSSKSYKRSIDSEKNINALLRKDNLLQTLTENNKLFKFDSSHFKINKSLEILSDDLKSLYHNTNEQDVTIWVDDGKLIAHGVILTCRSEYFKKALLSHHNNEIHIAGMNTKTLDAVLYYLYVGKLQQITDHVAMDLLRACNILNLPYLGEMTQNFLQSQISVTNVTDIFRISKEMKMDNLKIKALKFVAENHEDVSVTHQWNQMMRNDPHLAGEILLTIASFKNRQTNNEY